MAKHIAIDCCKNLNGIKLILICIVIISLVAFIYIITTSFGIDVYSLIYTEKIASSIVDLTNVAIPSNKAQIDPKNRPKKDKVKIDQKNYQKYLSHLKKNNSALKYLSILNDSERISYYMGKWYIPYHNQSVEIIDYNWTFFFRRYNLRPFIHRYSIFDETKNLKKINTTELSRGALNQFNIYIKPFWGFLHDSIKMNSFKCKKRNNNGDIILCIGDEPHHARLDIIPVFGKTRVIIGNYSQINNHIRKYSLILLQDLVYERHWGLPCRLYGGIQRERRSIDIPWNKKESKVIWRGATTGKIQRESFVKQYFNSNNTMIDVGFTIILSTRRYFGHLKKTTIKPRDLLKNKYLVSIEGNDVATNLKWILMSNSVVFMRQPRVETWLMEGLLKPYVHYVPLTMTKSIILATGTEIIQYQWNLEEQLQFCLDNDDACHQIAENGKLFMLGNTFCNIVHEKRMEARLLDMYCLNNKLIFSD